MARATKRLNQLCRHSIEALLLCSCHAYTDTGLTLRRLVSVYVYGAKTGHGTNRLQLVMVIRSKYYTGARRLRDLI